MKTLGTNRNIISNLDQTNTTKFTLKPNAKAFRILFDSLYSNKIRSIIRELWSNALDSQIRNGNPNVPFATNIPTQFEPYFSVRDFGTGMTHDKIVNVYTTVFESDKTDSNDFTGAFGLGAKTPFAYTDSFTITSYVNGVKTVYIANYDANSMPSLTLVGQTETDEPNGLLVTVPVETADFASFKQEAINVAFGYDTLPTAHGVELSATNPLLAANNWRAYDSARNYNTGTSSNLPAFGIRQGSVIYPVTDDQLGQRVSFGYGVSVIVDVPIGTVDITPSREALSFDTNTKNHVVDLHSQIKQQVETEIQQQVDLLPNFLAKVTFIEKLRPIIGNFARPTANYIICIGKKFVPQTVHVPAVRGIYWNDKSVEIPEIKIFNKRTLSSYYHSYQQFTVNSLFVIDRGEKLPRRVKRLYEYQKKNNIANLYVIVDPSSKQLERLMRCLGFKREQFISITNIPDCPPANTKQDSKTTTTNRAGVYHAGGRNVAFHKVEDLNRFESRLEAESLLWLPITSPVRPANELTLNFDGFGHIRRHLDDIGYYLASVLEGLLYEPERNLFKNPDTPNVYSPPLYLLTPRAVQSYGLTDTPDASSVLLDLLEQNKERLLNWLTWVHIKRMISNTVASELADHIAKTVFNIDSHKNAFSNVFSSTITLELSHQAEKTALEGLDKLADKYPMLPIESRKPTAQDYIEYMSTTTTEGTN